MFQERTLSTSKPRNLRCETSATSLLLQEVEALVGTEPLVMNCTEGRRPLGKPRHRWVDNIKIDLKEIGWNGIDWIDLAQGRNQWMVLVNMGLNIWVP
jgi:hypothetical protein